MKRLSTEYKRECVELVMIHGHRQKEVAVTMGVGLSTIQRWVQSVPKRTTGFHTKSRGNKPGTTTYSSIRGAG